MVASPCSASAAQDMTREKGCVPGTMMLTMNVNGALLILRACMQDERQSTFPLSI